MTVQAVEAFVDLIVADDMEQVRAVADRMIVMGGGRDALLTDLLAPAARCLGARWERDICDFTTVTLGVFRLDQIMKETESVSAMAIANVGFDRRILLIPAPGEQHNFGLNMVADVFRDGGWSVSTACAVSGREMVQLVAGEWFDMVGISVMTDRALKGLAENIQAARKASCNRKLCIMVGGRAVLGQPERDRPLNADLIAQDPQEALGKANVFLEATVTDRLHQYKTELVDIG
ncbi:MAG TPA: cobalamin-dependent protein [Acidocella sp.]|nr:cobalamin-dependent protein [Acidocella sp.]